MPKKLKPLNMLASIIVFGMGLLYLVIMEMTGALSLFPQSLDTQPLFWWPLIFLPTAIGLAVWAIGGLLITPLAPGPVMARMILGVGIGLFLAALAADKFGGVAIYADRVVVRDLNRFSLHPTVYRLEDVKEVRLECDRTTRRVRKGFRHNLNTVLDYKLILSDGRELNLAQGAYKREVQPQWLHAVKRLDETLSGKGVPRRLADNQSLQTYKQCVDMFRMDFSSADSKVYLWIMSPDT